MHRRSASGWVSAHQQQVGFVQLATVDTGADLGRHVLILDDAVAKRQVIVGQRSQYLVATQPRVSPEFRFSAH